MIRAPRRWSTLFAVTSVAFLAGVCAMWVRSYVTMDVYHAAGPGEPQSWWVASRGGLIRFERATFVTRAVNLATPNRRWDALGFSRGEAGPGAGGEGVYMRVAWLHVPYSSAAALAGVLAAGSTAVAVARGRRDRRRRRGLCPACGYDLRASPGRCPECGSGDTGPVNGSAPSSVSNLA